MRGYGVLEAREERVASWRERTPEPLPVAFIDNADWFLATKDFPELRETLLLIAEQDGVDGCRQFLTDNNIRWFTNNESDVRSDAYRLLLSAQSRRAA